MTELLPLVDVAHCGYCGSKLVNGSKYNYWTIKDTGERRAKKIPMYKCQNVWQGVPHDVTGQYKAEFIEPIVFESLTKYVEKLMENENILSEIEKNQNQERRTKEKELEKEKFKAEKNPGGYSNDGRKNPGRYAGRVSAVLGGSGWIYSDTKGQRTGADEKDPEQKG